MEAMSEQERADIGNFPRETSVASARMLAIRALLDAVGSFVVVDEEVIETA